MSFLYYPQPEVFTGYMDEPVVCDCCKQTKECYDGSAFIGEDKIKAICPDCLASGALNDLNVVTFQGDKGTLIAQLMELHPDWSVEKVQDEAVLKTIVLEKQTPNVITWQDWEWPVADGDYCQFIGYGYKEKYKQLAGDKKPKDFFIDSLYHTMVDDEEPEFLWKDYLTSKKIHNYDDSANLESLFYIFKSLHSDTIITMWDTM